MVIICKHHAAAVLLQDIDRGVSEADPTFEMVHDTVPIVISSLVDRLAVLQMDPGEAVLPVYTLIPKFHKAELGWRFLSLSHASVLKKASIWCTRLLKGLMPDANRIWCGHDFLWVKVLGSPSIG